ncbi:hypothetical protein GO685_02750 [Wolbachia endosymbiont of Madathamugadia hiepei]|nr:hypothetical protein [Wolbachia endosymbiont of Madathamugadia hiepei]NUX01422.1 hypothetical protein [Wolbachia endosymbiont of Madathamugadia hiepei]
MSILSILLFISLSLLNNSSKLMICAALVSVKKVYHEKIRKDVAKTGSLT